MKIMKGATLCMILPIEHFINISINNLIDINYKTTLKLSFLFFISLFKMKLSHLPFMKIF